MTSKESRPNSHEVICVVNQCRNDRQLIRTYYDERRLNNNTKTMRLVNSYCYSANDACYQAFFRAICWTNHNVLVLKQVASCESETQLGTRSSSYTGQLRSGCLVEVASPSESSVLLKSQSANCSYLVLVLVGEYLRDSAAIIFMS